MSPGFRVVAIIAMFNEADIIGDCIRALSEQGVDSYVLDDGSTDQSVSIVESMVGQRVIGIERLPSDGTFNLTRILRRKEQLERELEANWFVNHDADEFRESPWHGVTLADALRRVDTAGFNAVDFALFDFWPSTGSPNPTIGDGAPCSLGAAYNARQVRCWKKGANRVDLVSSAGHDVAFPDRRVFPLRFVLKHYPLRSAEHATRKIWRERVPRFDQQERAQGWHVQYDGLGDTATPAPAPDGLIVFDPVRVRMDTAVDDLQREAASTSAGPGSRDEELALTRGAQEASRHEVQRLQRLLDSAEGTRAALEEERTSLLERQRLLEERLTETTSARDEARARAHDATIAIEQQRRELAIVADEAKRALAEVEALRSSLDVSALELSSLQEESHEVRTALAAAERQLGSSDLERVRLSDERIRLLSDVAALMRALEDMRQSKSWRWSAPFRWVASVLGRR